jgi:hypothetical protein
MGVIADGKHGPHQLPTGRPSAPSAWLPAPSAKTSPTASRHSRCRRSAMTCSRHPSRPSSRTPARRWQWTGPTWRPSPARPPPKAATAPTPKPPGDTARNNLPGPKDELFYGYYFSAAVMMRDEHGPAVPELARRATLSSCRHDPARALVPVLTAMPENGILPGDPRRLRLRPPRRRRLGPSAARRRRAARPGPAPPRPRPQRHPPRRHHRQRQPNAPPRRGRCSNSGRLLATPHPNKPPHTTPAPPSLPATSSAAPPPTTPTATTAPPARPSCARSAARCGPPPWR